MTPLISSSFLSHEQKLFYFDAAFIHAGLNTVSLVLFTELKITGSLEIKVQS